MAKKKDITKVKAIKTPEKRKPGRPKKTEPVTAPVKNKKKPVKLTKKTEQAPAVSKSKKKPFKPQKKAINTPIEPNKKPRKISAKVKKDKRKRKGQLFHVVQHELSVYTKSKDIKLGKRFQSHASQIYRTLQEKKSQKTSKGSMNRFVKDNIEALFKKASDYYEEIPVVTPQQKPKSKKYSAYAESIPFFMVVDEFVKPQYQDIQIVFNSFYDGIIDFPMKEFESGIVFADWFERNLKPHCRAHYNNSPYAVLHLKADQSDDGFIEYELQVGVITSVTIPIEKPVEKVEPAEEKKIIPDIVPLAPEKPSSINRINEIQAKIDVLQKRKEALMKDIEFYERRGKKDKVAAAEAQYEAADDKIVALLNELDKL